MKSIAVFLISTCLIGKTIALPRQNLPRDERLPSQALGVLPSLKREEASVAPDGTQIGEGWKRNEEVAAEPDGTQIGEGWKRSEEESAEPDGTQIGEGWKRNEEGSVEPEGTQIGEGW